MLTTAELAAAMEKLRQARALIESVRGVFLGGVYIEGARMLREVSSLLSDEIAALDKAIGEGKTCE